MLGALRATALYAALTVLLTWPLARLLHVVDAGDSAFFAWEMAWELHAAEQAPASLPHANIFHPHRFALGMDEPILGTTVLALPLRLLTGDVVWIFNVVRLMTFVLSALGVYVLARELGVGEAPSLLAGALFAFSPIRTDQLAHLSTLGTQWLGFALFFLVRFSRSARLRHALAAAAFFALSAYACGYHAIAGLAILPLPCLALAWGRASLRRPAAIALVAAALLGTPLALLHRAALSPLAYERGAAETALYSARGETFLAASPWNRIYGEATASFRRANVNNLFTGIVPWLLVAAATASLLRRRAPPSREAAAFGLMVLAAAAVTLGPRVVVLGHDLGPGPFAVLREISLFRLIRVPPRAGVFIALGLAVLAALAWKRLRLSRPAGALVAAAAMAETLIVPVPSPSWSHVIDSRREPPPVYSWLAARSGDFAILELPIEEAKAPFRRPAFHESVYMLHSRHHWKRLLNGYSGVEPADYVALRQESKGFPSRESIERARSMGARYVVLHLAALGRERRERVERDLGLNEGASLRRVAQFGDDLVFELITDSG